MIDFSRTNVKESNLYSDIDISVDVGAKTSNVDWFGLFPSSTGEDDDGPSSEYRDSDGKQSYDASDSDQALQQNKCLEFNEKQDMLDEISLERGLILPSTKVLKKALR